MKLTIPLLFLLFGTIDAWGWQSDLIISTDVGQIGGTLLAEDNVDHPLVILITGSGAQDRDETILQFKPFKLIAEHLYEQGIPTFRYDDRQIGASTGIFREATLDDLASDVKAIMDYFQFRAEQNFDTFILLGHSQGGMVATRVAANNKDVVGLVYMAAPMVAMKEVINEQIVVIQTAMGRKEEDLTSTLEFQELAYETARTDEGWDSLKIAFVELLKEQIALLPEEQRAYITDVAQFAESQYNAQVAPIRSPQMRSLLFYNVGEELKSLAIPTLALYGAKDMQVTAKQNMVVYNRICEMNRLDCTAEHLLQLQNPPRNLF